jgi:hypothetical protein
MRRGRHSPTGFDTEAERAQQQQEAESAAAGSTGTGTGAGTTGTGPGPAAGAVPSARAGYERGMAPSAAYRAEVTGVAGADTKAGGVFSLVAGLLTFLAGLAGILRASFYPTLAGYAYSWPIRNWGILLLVLGVVLFALGACVLLGMNFARPAGVGVATLTAVAGFLFLAFAPIWGIIIVAVSVLAIWALLHDGAARRARA